MNRNIAFAVILALFAVFAQASPQSSKKPAGTALTGVVLGADNKPVSNAAVSCESSGGSSPRVVRSDAKGHFTILGLKQDSYDIRASASGSYSDWQRNIPLRKGQTKNVTLRLKNGPAPEAIGPPANPKS